MKVKQWPYLKKMAKIACKLQKTARRKQKALSPVNANRDLQMAQPRTMGEVVLGAEGLGKFLL